jgi:hypothetical protein
VECAEPELERTARRARRALWAFRLIFYPGAAVFALMLLPLALHGGARRDAIWLNGTTSQSEYFQLRIDPDRQPGRLTTVFEMKCGGTPYTVHKTAWWPYGPFLLHDGTLTIREKRTHRYQGRTWHRTVNLHARVTDSSVRGTMDFVEQLVDPGEYGPYYACESGPVTFSASAD